MGTKVQNNPESSNAGFVKRKVLGLKTISITARYIYSLLCTYFGNKTTCWPSQKTLREVSGLSIRTVIRSLNELIAAGIIKSTRKKYYCIYENLDMTLVSLLNSRYDTGVTSDMTNPANDTTIYIENKQLKEQYTSFIKFFNEITKRNFKGTEKSERQFNARIKEGAAAADFELAIRAARSDSWLRKNLKYLTPEYITRPDQFQKWLNHGRIQVNRTSDEGTDNSGAALLGF